MSTKILMVENKNVHGAFRPREREF